MSFISPLILLRLTTQYRADLLRDEALIYDHVLRENGVNTKVDVYPGIPHGGPDFFPMHSCAERAVRGLKAGVEWIMGSEEV
jgi:acetyl esterase/lipase